MKRIARRVEKKIMKKWLVVLGIVLMSFCAIKFCFGEGLEDLEKFRKDFPITSPIEYIDKVTVIEKQILINADVNVDGNLKCRVIKSKTTDGLIISNIVMGVLIIAILL